MKDHVKGQLAEAGEFSQVKAIVDDFADYCNDIRHQWRLAKLSPNEYYQFCTTGKYPIKISDSPAPPVT